MNSSPIYGVVNISSCENVNIFIKIKVINFYPYAI